MEIEAKLVALAAWMKKNYGGTMIQALKTVLPIKQKENAKVKKRLRLLLDEGDGQAPAPLLSGEKTEGPGQADGSAS